MLSLLILLPLIGALAALLLPERFLRPAALAGSLATLGVALLVPTRWNPAIGDLQLVESYAWIPQFGIRFIIGLDGLSFPMILLTALLSAIAVIASWKIDRQPRGYFSLLLFLESAMIGVFLSLDLFLFFIFWELMLLPMYFLIGIWGSPSRVDPDGRTRGGPYAAIKFFLYTLIGSLAMLVGILWIGADAGTFDIRAITVSSNQTLLWFLFFAAFAVKIPAVPLHTWLPDAHVEAPTAVSVLLAGVLLKMGAYGLLRFNFALFPFAMQGLGVLLAALGVINILYGGLCAMAQKDLKRLVAYSSIAHMGFVLLGFGTVDSVEALTGAALQMFNHGTITAMLFLLVGVIYDRVGHRDIDRLGGLVSTMPRYSACVILAFFASLGLPGLSAFIGEVLVILGAWKTGYRAFVVLAALGIVITAAYHLWVIKRGWMGNIREELRLPDLSARETLTLAPLAIIVIWIGVYPSPMISLIHETIVNLVK